MKLRPFPRGIFFASAIFGLLLMWHSYSRGIIATAQDPATQAVLAVDVARLTEANTNLRRQLAELTNQELKLAQALVDRRQAEESLAAKQEQAAILAATTAVHGPGVIMIIHDQLTIPQVIDIINALKNIGAEAIAVNGVRVGAVYSEWRANLAAPYTIMALGSPAALLSSLDRRGGVIDQIEMTTGALELTIEKSDELSLPAAAAPSRQYAELLVK